MKIKEVFEDNKKLVVVVGVTIIVLLCVISFSLGKSSGSRNCNKNAGTSHGDNIKEEDNNSNNDNNTGTNNTLTDKELGELIDKSIEIVGTEKSQFLDSILGDYLAKADSGNGTGIYFSKEGNDYKYLKYALHTDTGNHGVITKVSKSNVTGKYVLTVFFEEVITEAYQYLQERRIVVVDVNDISNGKLEEYATIYHDGDSKRTINKNSIKYTKFNGEFTDWDSKDRFVEGL